MSIKHEDPVWGYDAADGSDIKVQVRQVVERDDLFPEVQLEVWTYSDRIAHVALDPTDAHNLGLALLHFAQEASR